MKTELTEDEKKATLDAIGRFKENDPELVKIYEIEFVIANCNKPELAIESFLNECGIRFEEIKRVESDVLVVIKMKLDSRAIIVIESHLTYFANNNNFKYDGWGAFE